ncbi:hypothetical protein MNAN1_000829 [Malassezia nana]|uniref:SRR1-like domain-containing protein n=1 Tax=Malassezia nana TaxID=180528 RepID=A0AAF0EPJ7_9BASI|nr:hypothetical protein MNAN1_000829 [Malassezia nana]
MGRNECGGYSFTSPTLLYMPHCPKELYENVLRANWDRQRLQTLVLCGNELDMYALHNSLPCISRLVPYVQSYRLPAMQTHVAGALDAAVQVFFSSLPHVPPTTSSDDGFYQAATRKARTRARRGQSTAKSTPPPLRSDDPAFWQLPPPTPVGEEILTTPVPDGVL